MAVVQERIDLAEVTAEFASWCASEQPSFAGTCRVRHLEGERVLTNTCKIGSGH